MHMRENCPVDPKLCTSSLVSQPGATENSACAPAVISARLRWPLPSHRQQLHSQVAEAQQASQEAISKAACPVDTPAKHLLKGLVMLESPCSPCCGRYCSCWLASEVSVRSLKTLCTCGLGGALLNICVAWLTAQSLHIMHYPDELPITLSFCMTLKPLVGAVIDVPIRLSMS